MGDVSVKPAIGSGSGSLGEPTAFPAPSGGRAGSNRGLPERILHAKHGSLSRNPSATDRRTPVAHGGPPSAQRRPRRAPTVLVHRAARECESRSCARTLRSRKFRPAPASTGTIGVVHLRPVSLTRIGAHLAGWGRSVPLEGCSGFQPRALSPMFHVKQAGTSASGRPTSNCASPRSSGQLSAGSAEGGAWFSRPWPGTPASSREGPLLRE